jgi:hypothetical protein
VFEDRNLEFPWMLELGIWNFASRSLTPRPSAAIYRSTIGFTLHVNVSSLTLSPHRQMNPDKLFDYLNGKLSDSEREEIERQLATDPHLQRELAMAREIHSRMHDSREVLIPDNIVVNRGAVLGRRVAIAFAVLVFINVLFGLYAIAFMEKKRRGRPPEEQNRQQLAEAVEKAAASALPTPTLDIGEVILRADAGQRDAVVKELIEGAEKYGGSGTRGLPDDNGLLVIVQLPSRRAEAFLERLERIGGTVPESRHESATNGTTVIQVRVIEDASP